jgi:hypothetical protein
MGHKFAQIAFTESVRGVQQALGSRAGYAAMDEGEDYNHVLGEREKAFIAARDSFYMASVSETGWPYLHHRGGTPGPFPAGETDLCDQTNTTRPAVMHRKPEFRTPGRFRSVS